MIHWRNFERWIRRAGLSSLASVAFGWALIAPATALTFISVANNTTDFPKLEFAVLLQCRDAFGYPIPNVDSSRGARLGQIVTFSGVPPEAKCRFQHIAPQLPEGQSQFGIDVRPAHLSWTEIAPEILGAPSGTLQILLDHTIFRTMEIPLVVGVEAVGTPPQLELDLKIVCVRPEDGAYFPILPPGLIFRPISVAFERKVTTPYRENIAGIPMGSKCTISWEQAQIGAQLAATPHVFAGADNGDLYLTLYLNPRDVKTARVDVKLTSNPMSSASANSLTVWCRLITLYVRQNYKNVLLGSTVSLPGVPVGARCYVSVDSVEPAPSGYVYPRAEEIFNVENVSNDEYLFELKIPAVPVRKLVLKHEYFGPARTDFPQVRTWIHCDPSYLRSGRNVIVVTGRVGETAYSDEEIPIGATCTSFQIVYDGGWLMPGYVAVHPPAAGRRLVFDGRAELLPKPFVVGAASSMPDDLISHRIIEPDNVQFRVVPHPQSLPIPPGMRFSGYGRCASDGPLPIGYLTDSRDVTVSIAGPAPATGTVESVLLGERCSLTMVGVNVPDDYSVTKESTQDQIFKIGSDGLITFSPLYYRNRPGEITVRILGDDTPRNWDVYGQLDCKIAGQLAATLHLPHAPDPGGLVNTYKGEISIPQGATCDLVYWSAVHYLGAGGRAELRAPFSLNTGTSGDKISIVVDFYAVRAPDSPYVATQVPTLSAKALASLVLLMLLAAAVALPRVLLSRG
jgi:hypothetical protein